METLTIDAVKIEACCDYHDGFNDGMEYARVELARLRAIEVAARACLSSRKGLAFRLTDMADAMGSLELPT